MQDEPLVCEKCGFEIDPDSDFAVRTAEGVPVHHTGDCPVRLRRSGERRTSERREGERRNDQPPVDLVRV